MGFRDPLLAFLVELYHLGFVFLLLAFPRVGRDRLAGLEEGENLLILCHSPLMLLYNNINSFSKDEIADVAIDKLFFFVKEKLRIS